jgi:hypothetical protein
MPELAVRRLTHRMGCPVAAAPERPSRQAGPGVLWALSFTKAGGDMAATRTLDFPAELRRDRAWRAVLHVLETAFPTDPRVWIYISAGEEWGIDFEAMLAAGTWSGGEKALLKATASLFHPDYAVSVWELAHQLSDNNWALFLEALAILRGEEK